MNRKKSPWRTFSAKRFVFFIFVNHNSQNDRFGMFIVLTLHRESLRKMMQDGNVNNSIKVHVLQMLKKQVCSDGFHGDIKDFLVSHNEQMSRSK